MQFDYLPFDEIDGANNAEPTTAPAAALIN
jgi:hypothetical protein